MNEASPGDIIRRFAQRNKVDVDILDTQDKWNPHPDTWALDGIHRQEGSEKGSGAKVIRAIHKLADRHKKSVELVPDSLTGDQEKLENYYKNLGYKPKYGRMRKFLNPKLNGDRTWIRKPK